MNQAKLQFEYKETDENIVVAVFLYKVGEMEPRTTGNIETWPIFVTEWLMNDD